MTEPQKSASARGLVTASPLPVYDLGLAPYVPLQELQARLRRQVAEGTLSGMVLLLEHPPTITLGKRAKPTDVLGPLPPGLELVESERGGAATLHAPGQLVSYPILALPRRDLRAYVRNLEEVLLRVLAAFGLKGRRADGRPGLYIGEQKIASVGLKCERWVASHGTSLNVDPDLSLFRHLVSCAEPQLEQTSIAALLGAAPPLTQIKERYLEAFREVFELPLDPVCRAEWTRLVSDLTQLEAESERNPSLPDFGF
ncbi:MAG: lipoyl(octanoyl) transferase LipB [Thermoleophilia bacterium]